MILYFSYKLIQEKIIFWKEIRQILNRRHLFHTGTHYILYGKTDNIYYFKKIEKKYTNYVLRNLVIY